MKQHTCIICGHMWAIEKKEKTLSIRSKKRIKNMIKQSLYALLEGIDGKNRADDGCSIANIVETTLLPKTYGYCYDDAKKYKKYIRFFI